MGQELSRIRWIRALERAGQEALVVPLGDDAVAWKPPGGHAAVLTVDAQVEGTHFLAGWLTPRELGRRAVHAAASDLAAMAAAPVGILVALVLPDTLQERAFRALHRGIHAAATDLGLRVLGGNISSGPLSITVTAVGSGPPGRLCHRSGARPGDAILVTGSPGLASLGLESLLAAARAPRSRRGNRSRGGGKGHRAEVAARRAWRLPSARIREALALRERLRPTSLIDISDGLATDLTHLLEESRSRKARGPGARLDAAALLRLPGLLEAARALGSDPLEAALQGGEAYELLLTAPPPRWREATVAGTRVSVVGRIELAPGLRLVHPGGQSVPVEPRGWEHGRRR